MVDGQLESLALLGAAGKGSRMIADPHLGPVAQKAEAAVLSQRSGEQPRLAQDLEPVADADHEAAVASMGRDRVHYRGEACDGAGAKVVAVGETAGQDDDVGAVKVGLSVPQKLDPGSEPLQHERAVALAVGAGKHGDGGPHRHRGSTTTSKLSITGFASRRAQTSLTRLRASSSSVASICKEMLLPTRTELMPCRPRAGSARSIVCPWGSEMPSLGMTSTLAR